ncbi:MAG: RHS repeat-associated core domain-containing protein [Luteolibacter sp.]
MKRQLNTLALMALITSTAFAGFNAPLPEFKTPEQLAEWRAELAAKSAASTKATTQDTAFYTGKPYVESTGTYAFKYRSYNPEMARWTSEDPSGFPDGANSSIYAPNPNSEFDYQGLVVVAQYSITMRNLTIDNATYHACNSGDNIYSNCFSMGGPIPTGVYSIFSREQGNATFFGHQAFILDPVDSIQYNDIWNGGDAGGRTGFRIHLDGTTEGCIATASIDAIASQFWSSGPTVRHDIVQAAPTANPVTFRSEYYFGTLTVVE